jgi:aconitate hydratase
MAMPKVVRVELTGRLRPWVSAKDVILELLRRLTVKGGVDRVFEYGGPGVATLSIPERSTITNMGAELGATTSVFPSDGVTRAWLVSQKRGEVWTELKADDDATYDDRVEIELSALEPLIALPGSPDAVVPVREVEGTRAVQVNIGSCTNSSYRDLATVAMILRGRTVHPNCSATVSPGSKQVMTMIARDGFMTDIVGAGVRVLESACGPCIGMGQTPPTDGVSVRTFNRNFEGRCGSATGRVYLASVEVAAATAIYGEITDPRKLGEPVTVRIPAEALVDDGMIVKPPADPSSVEIIRGPNIKPLPAKTPIADRFTVRVLLKTGDNISTDHIMPAGAKVLPLRSNIPAISEFVFYAVDQEFPTRAREWGGGVIVGGHNYGQGSSREHAALAPMYLGVTAVLVRSFARIHRANLINFGILPLTVGEADYEALAQGDELEFVDVHASVLEQRPVKVRNETKGTEFEATAGLSARQAKLLLAGGLLNYTRDTA